MSEPEPEPDPVFVTVTLTCHTDGCENAEIPIEASVPDNTTAAQCGACGQQITDIQEDPEAPVSLNLGAGRE